MKKLEKNEVLLWFGSWTSKIGNIVFDYANSMSTVSSFSGKTWILALYQSSETIIQIIFNDCSITKNELKSLENTEFSCQK